MRMLSLLLAVLLAGCGGGGGNAEKVSSYGSIALKMSGQSVVGAKIVVGKASQDIADAVALSECGSLCTVGYRFTNDWICAGVARGRKYYSEYVSKGNSATEAGDNALTMCVTAAENQCTLEE
jgi:hypothetical protein